MVLRYRFDFLSAAIMIVLPFFWSNLVSEELYKSDFWTRIVVFGGSYHLNFWIWFRVKAFLSLLLLSLIIILLFIRMFNLTNNQAHCWWDTEMSISRIQYIFIKSYILIFIQKVASLVSFIHVFSYQFPLIILL